MSIFVSRELPAPGMERLVASGVKFEVGPTSSTDNVPRDELLDGVRRHDVLLCLLTERVDREVLTANPRLRGVSVMAVGLDSVDRAAAAELGIRVLGTPAVLTNATADLAFGLLLSVARRIPEAHNYMVGGRYGLWGAELLCGSDVSPGPVANAKKVLGILGYGRIGQAMARRAAGFEVDVIALARGSKAPNTIDELGVRFVTLPELLAQSDFVSIHTPLTPETHHLIGAEELKLMKSSAILINTARGPVVDERALVSALTSGEIAGAGLDVFEGEPQMAAGLAGLANVVLLPHIGSATWSTRGAMATAAVENALSCLATPSG